MIIKIHNVYIRPIQEYADVIWNKEKNSEIKKLEKMHRTVTAIAIKNPPYWGSTYKTYAQRLNITQTQTISQLHKTLITKFIINIIKGEAITYLKETLTTIT